MQNEYIIEYDTQQDLYFCYINNELTTAEFVIDLLHYIAKLYQYANWHNYYTNGHIMSLDEYVKALEDLDIKIVMKTEGVE